MTEPARRRHTIEPNVVPIEEVAFDPARASDAGTRRKRLLLGSVGLLLGGVIALGLWFVFTARSVQVVVTPTTSDVVFDAGWLQFRLGDRYLVRAGEARVTARHEGYYPLDETVVVGDDNAQRFEYELQKTPGRLLVNFDHPVEVATIVVDAGEPWVGRSGELSAGEHDIAIRVPRFADYTTSVRIEGRGVEQQLDVELIPDWADVRFESQPAGAQIIVDGKVVATTPAVVPILSGDHAVSVSAPGHKDWKRPLRVVANQPREFIDIALAKADGSLNVVSSPPGAAVSVNGRYRGTTPLDLRLPPGKSYRLAISKAGFSPVARQVSVRSDQDQTIDVALEQELGELRLKLQPANATVFVDGVAQNPDGDTLTLSAVEHTIEVKAPGHLAVSKSYTPNPGFVQDVKISLLTLEAAREAALKKELTTSGGHRLLLMRPEPFAMGASRREQGRRANEVKREVRHLSEFYIATKEVTNKEYRAFQASHESGNFYSANLDLPDLPVVNVTWDSAARYCNWLSEKDGLEPAYEMQNGRLRVVLERNGYRLPTEAEWAWSARFAADQRGPRFPWGSDLPPNKDAGNFADRAAVGMTTKTLRQYSDGFAATAPVGQFVPSPAGLYDIGGNVSEWTSDEYTVGLSATIDDGGNGYHVIRGSSWMHADISELRLTYRDYSDVQRPDVGFRLAKTMEEPEL